MTKTEMIDKVAADTGVTKTDTRIMLNAFLKAIADELAAGGSIKFSELGSFTVGTVSEHDHFNAFTGTIVHCPDQKRVRFRASKKLKDRLNS